MADNNQKEEGEKEKGSQSVDYPSAISSNHTSIRSIEVHSGGAVAIGKNAQILIKQESVKVQHNIWWKVSPPVATFVGRNNEIEELQMKLFTARGSTVAITGLGGMGKSELARKYARIWGPSSFNSNVVWITAESTTSLTNAFVSLSEYLGIRDEKMSTQARTELVYDKFRNVESLFIFDNAEKMSTISPFLPYSNPVAKTPYVIITSQVMNWPDTVMIVQLNNLDESDASNLIKNNLTKVNENDAKLLARELQCFPLALQQAIAYIKKFNRRRKFTVSDYLKAFQNKTKDVLDTVIPYSEYGKTVYATWNMTFDRLKESENYKQVMHVLGMITFMHADEIPFTTFLAHSNQEEDEIWSIVDNLEQYCLIKQTNCNESSENEEAIFAIHRLLQKVLQLTLGPNDRTLHLGNTLQQMQHFVLGGFGNYSRDRKFMYHAMTAWDYAKNIEEFRLKYCYLPIKIADALLYQGRYSESLDYATGEFEFLAHNLGENHHSTLSMLFNKARSYHCLSKLQDAVVLYKEAIEKQKIALGEMHCDTHASEMDLAFCYIDLQEPEVSLKIFEKVYFDKKVCEQTKCSDKKDEVELYSYRDIYTAIYGIGHALQLLKRYDEAEEQYEIFYEKRRQMDGECHPRRLHAGNKLAEIKIEKGQYTEAHELLKDVYKKQVETLSDSHPHCMTSFKNIIRCLEFEGNIEEARRHLGDLHEKMQKRLGPEHMDTKKIEKMIKDFNLMH